MTNDPSTNYLEVCIPEFQLHEITVYKQEPDKGTAFRFIIDSLVQSTERSRYPNRQIVMLVNSQWFDSIKNWMDENRLHLLTTDAIEPVPANRIRMRMYGHKITIEEYHGDFGPIQILGMPFSVKELEMPEEFRNKPT